MSIDESDARNINDEVLIEAACWRLRGYIRVGELASTHRLGKMRRLRMLEGQRAWKREASFDRIDTAAEVNAQRFRTSLFRTFLQQAVQSEMAPYSQRIHA